MFQGQFDLDAAIPVQATAIPDALFERGLYWASGRSGVVNLVAAHKWFNLAALKGRADAISHAPRGRRDDVGCRNRHRAARSPRVDDGALISVVSTGEPISDCIRRPGRKDRLGGSLHGVQ